MEILLLFLPLPGVEEEVSSRSPPPLTLLEGEVALLLLELDDIAGRFNNRLATKTNVRLNSFGPDKTRDKVKLKGISFVHRTIHNKAKT